MRRLVALPLLLVLAGCDAGNRADPGSDNALRSPFLVVSTPYEGQQVVPEPPGSPVRALFDLQGATLGRCAGSKVRYRLDRQVVPPDGKPVLTPVSDWTVLERPAEAVSLGALPVATDPEGGYVLTAEVLDKDGKPWTREEAGADAAAAKRVVNPSSRVVRRFTVHPKWKDASGKG
jgi:hypothetical protein